MLLVAVLRHILSNCNHHLKGALYLQQSIHMRNKECQENFSPLLHPTDCNVVIDNDYDDYDDDDDVGDVDEEDVDSQF